MTHQPIFVPTNIPDDWQKLLADVDKHWKIGYSARTLAYCWHAADGFPPEVTAVFARSPFLAFHVLEPLLMLPEYKVELKGAGRDSQNDLFVLAKASDGHLISIMVEGKVNEAFGEQLSKWKSRGTSSANRQTRFSYLQAQLGLTYVPDEIYYQLLHRSASAVIAARRFNAKYAAMLIHSFSPQGKWFEEYARFIQLFHQTALKNTLHYLTTVDSIEVFSAWVSGDSRFQCDPIGNHYALLSVYRVLLDNRLLEPFESNVQEALCVSLQYSSLLSSPCWRP